MRHPNEPSLAELYKIRKKLESEMKNLREAGLSDEAYVYWTRKKKTLIVQIARLELEEGLPEEKPEEKSEEKHEKRVKKGKARD